MAIAVLAKVVPDTDSVVYDEARHTTRREGTELFLNPFDLRAVLVGLAMRRSQEPVRVFSMGPAGALKTLRTTLALGADELVLISDPCLAGSDTLVTARVIATALRKYPSELILAGAWSVDSSTAQVPAQLAELLDYRLVGPARSVGWGAEGDLDVTVQTEEGRQRIRSQGPCVVTVGEKAAKVRHPTEEQLVSAGTRAHTLLTLADLGIFSESVGLVGSPTEVARVTNDEPTRGGHVLKGGAPPELVERALKLLPPLMEPGLRQDGPAEAPPAPLSNANEVLFLASGAEGSLDPHSLPLASAVLGLGTNLVPVAVGFGPIGAPELRQLASVGVRRVCWAHWPHGRFGPEAASALAGEALRVRPQCRAFLFVSTYWGREAAGRLSARCGLGLTGDAIGLAWSETYGIVGRKASFGGSHVADVRSKTTPHLLTVRPGAFPMRSGRWPGVPEIIDLVSSPPQPRVTVEDVVRELDPRFGDLDSAPIVVGVGMGLGGSERVPELLALLRPGPMALGATRKVVDSGWVPYQLQIGLTGRFIAPEVYVAIGTSGKANHLVGVKRARHLISINPDPTSPILAHSDIGIVGTWEEVLPPLLEGLSARQRSVKN